MQLPPLPLPRVPDSIFTETFSAIDHVVRQYLNSSAEEAAWYAAVLANNESYISGGIAGEPFQRDYYYHVASSPGIRRVCETGFNAGHRRAVR